jgi:hypothetical protein
MLFGMSKCKIETTAIKSKCSRCSLCFGLIDIHRDVALEVEEEKFEIEKGLKPYGAHGEEKKLNLPNKITWGIEQSNVPTDSVQTKLKNATYSR